MTSAENFTVSRLEIPDVLKIVTRRFTDDRGYFVEIFRAAAFVEFGIDCDFVQDNQSSSVKPGTIRGLHFQTPPSSQAKLLRVLRGRIFDVAVDIRKGSATYGRWCGATLSDGETEWLFIPRGFAHGFCTLEPHTEVTYKVDNYYDPRLDAGLLWNDPDLAINWPVEEERVTVSQKDRVLPRFRDFDSPFSL